jgi:hypothetical protein
MSDEYRELLIGCGHKRDKRLWWPTDEAVEWQRKFRNLVTLDVNPDCDPDLLVNLNAAEWRVQKVRPEGIAIECIEDEGHPQYWRVARDVFDEIHAYEVLEHLGQQGDAVAFFETFTAIWNALKPGGRLLATVPSRFSPWLWGDPSHRRVILPETLSFLDQGAYARQLDCAEAERTSMSDFRGIYKADFATLYSFDNKQSHLFVLRAIKPSRLSP